MGKRKLKLQLREARACVDELLSQRNDQDGYCQRLEAEIRQLHEEINRHRARVASLEGQNERLLGENAILQADWNAMRARVNETFTSEEPQEREDVQAAIAASKECQELVRHLWEAIKALSDAMVHKANASVVAGALKDVRERLDSDRASIALVQSSVIDIEKALAGVNLLVSADRETLAQHSLALADLKADIEQLRPSNERVVPRVA